MSKIWEPQDKLVYQNWIDTIICEASDELNDWEIKFIESLRIRLLTGKNLTEGQASKLESIYTDKTH